MKPMSMEHFHAIRRRIADDAQKLTQAEQYRRDLAAVVRLEQEVVERGGTPEFFQDIAEVQRVRNG